MGNLLLAFSPSHVSWTLLTFPQKRDSAPSVCAEMLTGISSDKLFKNTLIDSRFSFLHHQLHELIVVNAPITVLISFTDHLIDFIIRKLLSDRGHDMTQLSG